MNSTRLKMGCVFRVYLGKIIKKITTTAISDIFGSQADQMTVELSVLIKPWSEKIRSGEWSGSFDGMQSMLEKTLSTRKWIKNSPGWNAFFSPLTPLDKMFQIHVITLLQYRDFADYSVLDHKIEMEAMEKGIAQARHFALQSIPAIQDMKKEGKASGLKDAILVAFSHMLPCGDEDEFPPSVRRLGGNQLALYNVLFQNGMVMHASNTGLQDFGQLKNIYSEAVMASGRLDPGVSQDAFVF